MIREREREREREKGRAERMRNSWHLMLLQQVVDRGGKALTVFHAREQ